MAELALLDIAVGIAGGELVHPTSPAIAPDLGPDVAFVPMAGMRPLRSGGLAAAGEGSKSYASSSESPATCSGGQSS